MVYSIYYASDFRGFPRGQFRRRRFPDSFPRRGGGIFWPYRFAHAPMQRPGQPRRRNERFRGPEFLQQLSTVTSGRFYQSELTDLKKTFSLIADELRHQYRLGFYPDELHKDGAVHQLRVKVKAADVAVRARRNIGRYRNLLAVQIIKPHARRRETKIHGSCWTVALLCDY